MLEFDKIDTPKGIIQWHELIRQFTPEASVAFNPELFNFFTGYLGFPAYYIILQSQAGPFGLASLIKTGKKTYCSIPHFSCGGLLPLGNSMTVEMEAKMMNLLADCIEKNKLRSGFYNAGLDKIGEQPIQAKFGLEIRSDREVLNYLREKKILHAIKLMTSVDEQFERFSSSVKRKIRKAERNGLKVTQGGKNLIKDFSRVYNRNMQSLGSPSLGKEFFTVLSSNPGLHAEVFVCYAEGKAVGAAFSFGYISQYENTWFSTTGKFNHLYTSYLLHWTMIQRAIQLGASVYSMGRSTPDSGVQKYKSQWPATESTLYFSSSAPAKFRLKNQRWLGGVWKALPPAVADTFGPFFAKKLY